MIRLNIINLAMYDDTVKVQLAFTVQTPGEDLPRLLGTSELEFNDEWSAEITRACYALVLPQL